MGLLGSLVLAVTVNLSISLLKKQSRNRGITEILYSSPLYIMSRVSPFVTYYCEVVY
ncbi:hypothetical protein Scep_013734 [Stephania cephalantha]|uniref:Uncharacterized protein n=1 Tax=Stephania cephalantha TaxID=152367 RepID=A0AAP0J008_9MAGN